MFTLTLGLSLFFALHSLREFGWREGLVSRHGASIYKTFLALGIALSIALIVIGKSNAGFIQIWVPPFNLRSLTHLLMISSCILIAAGILPASYTRSLLLHPMLTGVLVWGTSHLLANGDLASILLFGSLSVWSVYKYLYLERHKDKQAPQAVPSLVWDAAAILLGMFAYIVLLVFHGQLFGFALSTIL